MMVTVSPIPHQEIEYVFGLIKEYLSNVYRKTDIEVVFTPEDLLKGLLQRKLQLWVGWIPTGKLVGFAITKLDSYSGGKTCTVIACGASDEYKHDWTQYIKTIEDWATNIEECTMMLVEGRQGWTKKLRENGYQVDSVVLKKRLSKDEDHNKASPPVEQLH